MEPENALDLGMIGGRLRTIREMRTESTSPFLPIAKLEAAIDTLRASETMLHRVRKDIEDGTMEYRDTIDQVDGYLAGVMDELEILETQHTILLQEVLNRPPSPQYGWVGENRPTFGVAVASTPNPVPFVMNTEQHSELVTRWSSAWDQYTAPVILPGGPPVQRNAESCPDWYLGSNVEKLIARADLWTIPMSEWISLPDMFLLKRQIDQPSKDESDILNDLKRHFWTVPQIRFEILCLIYHYYSRRPGDTGVSFHLFREWLVELLVTLTQPEQFRNLLIRIPHTKLLSEAELGLPLKNSMEEKMIALLWLSLPRGDQEGARILQRLTECTGLPFQRYVGWMVWFKKYWEEGI
jgi:hypothetical protein